MKDIFYRQLQPQDYEGYKSIRLYCLRHFPDNFGSTYEEELKIESFKLSQSIKLPDKFNFVTGCFNYENKLIGICGFVTGERIKTRHRGEIVQLFVLPEYCKIGIGKNLLKHTIINAFENGTTEQINLAVVASNLVAINLYKQLGFVEYGRLENYFKSGEKYSTQLFFSLSKKKNRISLL